MYRDLLISLQQVQGRLSLAHVPSLFSINGLFHWCPLTYQVEKDWLLKQNILRFILLSLYVRKLHTLQITVLNFHLEMPLQHPRNSLCVVVHFSAHGYCRKGKAYDTISDVSSIKFSTGLLFSCYYLFAWGFSMIFTSALSM